ncbi:MAG: glycoside hydrolase family 127 protein [Oscillospiraceae bacterium]|nr:glycoside hydrolase family 127 protein [Oscillospiraceae bacterium]
MKPQIYNNNENNKVKDKIFTPLNGVKLNAGLFSRVFENNIKYLQTINIDSALYWFRKRAGKYAPGEPYHGHFEDNLHGQTAGLILMGAGNALRWTNDEKLRKIVDFIISEIKDCGDNDGYIMAIERELFATKEYPHYVRIWVTYGLYAAYLSGNKDAGILLKSWQNWFNNECGDLPVIKYLSLAFQGVVCSPFVYNTPFGSKKDIEITQKYYEETWRLGQYIMGEKDVVQTRRQHGYEPHPHGTEIEAFEGYLDLYKATGNYYYINAVNAFYEAYKKDWQHAGGGIVMCEFETSTPGCTWLTPPRAYNELCCTAFWIWLNQRFHRLYPDEEKYVNEIEKSLYNIAIANQDGDKAIRYFAWLEGERAAGGHTHGGLVHCCCGVGTRLFGMLPEFLYSVNEDSVYLDIYSSSEFTWERENNTVNITQISDMPYNGKVTVNISCEKSEKFKVMLRMPSWADGDVEVMNGSEKYCGKPGTYFCIEKIWESGADKADNTIEFELRFKWNLIKYTGVEQVEGFDRYALEYGPLLMSAVLKDKTENTGNNGGGNYLDFFRLSPDPKDFKSWLVKDKKPLTYNIKGCDNIVYMPYFEVETGSYFTCYPLYK